MSGRINFHTLAAPPRRVFEKTFTDPVRPELSLFLRLEEPDALTDYEAAEISAELVRRYIDGNPELGMAAQPFMVGEEARQLSPLLCDDVGRVVAMQPKDPEAYQGEEVLMMAFKARGLWVQVRRWARELYIGAGDALPNASGAAAEQPSSVPPSNEEPSTPPSSTTSADRSGLSFAASGAR